LVELPEAKEDDPEAIARVCAIFEKLNSTGVELSVYDLLTARLYSSRIDLHNLWDEACGKHKRLAEWSEGQAHINRFGVLVLRTLALLRGLEAKPSTLIKLQASDFERDWKRAAAAMERAIELATLVGPDGFGVFDRKWMPGLALLPVLAALRAQVDDRGLPESARVDLRRWYWCNVFLERYSSAVESKSRKDYSEFMGYWKEGKGEPAVFGEARALIGADGYTIRDAASYASNVYNGVFCLLALRGARDWRLGENIQLQDLHDHHIFPRAYLRTAGLEQSNQINSIVNRTLIGDETNGKIKDAAPAQYLANAEIFKQDEAKIRSLLAPHFISASTLEIMRRATPGLSDADAVNVYRQFMKAREAAIINEIRYVCGIA